MKLVGIKIKDGKMLEIKIKKSIFKGIRETIREVERGFSYSFVRDLKYKYYGWEIDEDKNIIFRFRLLDAERDIKPYITAIDISKYEDFDLSDVSMEYPQLVKLIGKMIARIVNLEEKMKRGKK